MAPSVILMPNWIGDLLLALSVVMKMPEERLSGTTLLVPQQMTGLVGALSTLPHLPFARSSAEERRRTLEEVRCRGFRSIYLLPFSFSSALFAVKTGIPHRRGLSREFRRLLLTDPLPGKLRDRSHHILREYAEILQTAYVSPEKWEGVPVPPEKAYPGSIVFCPGAKYGPAKQWNNFPDLGRQLTAERIVVLGTNEERAAAGEIVRSAPGRVTDLTGRTSLQEAAAVMSAARAVVSNDSGLMHLAGFLGVPVIGIFGSTSPAWTRPLGRHAVTMSGSEPCAPCFRRECRYGHYRCLDAVTTADVMTEIAKLFSLHPIPPGKRGK
ncbi:MAG: lipopolysaccharide heptosyltransferase II [Prosthecochloris sp.]|nr:lipopolysaccharide heptosyltransferase II [Prosthecochloris sp.]